MFTCNCTDARSIEVCSGSVLTFDSIVFMTSGFLIVVVSLERLGWKINGLLVSRVLIPRYIDQSLYYQP